MKIIEINNKKKYNKGDIIIYDGIVSIIDDVIEEKRDSKILKEIGETILAKRRVMSSKCCSSKYRSKEVELDIFKFTYVVGRKKIEENKIKSVGIKSVNDFIRTMKKELDEANKKMSKVADILGYNNDY